MITRLFHYSLILASALLLPAGVSAEKRYAGGDVSLLPKYEAAGAHYKTHDGEPVADVLAFCREEGMNAMRVRVFVNPADYDGADKDPNACQTIDEIIPLCRRIKDTGFALMLDFMYSDTWADPAKQWTPKQWAGMNDTQLNATIHDYTKECLQKLKDAGAAPDFIQTGNEISFGMLWGPANAAETELKKCFMGSDKNWARLGGLLNNAVSACREVCPDAKIVIHTERIADVSVQRNFYNQIKRLNVDYDIIGISYYPYFHGSLSRLNTAVTDLEKNFPEKDIMVVETGFPYKWEVPGTTEKVDYPYTDAGQNKFATDLVNMLEKHVKVTGLLWWWMEYNAYGTSLSGWYNAPLFDSTTGKATAALKTIAGFATDDASVGDIGVDIPDANVRWYNINGVAVDIDNDIHGLFIGSDGSKRVK